MGSGAQCRPYYIYQGSNILAVQPPPTTICCGVIVVSNQALYTACYRLSHCLCVNQAQFPSSLISITHKFPSAKRWTGEPLKLGVFITLCLKGVSSFYTSFVSDSAKLVIQLIIICPFPVVYILALCRCGELSRHFCILVETSSTKRVISG